MQQGILEPGIAEGLGQSAQQRKVQVGRMSWHGDETEKSNRPAFIAGRKINGRAGNSQGHAHLTDRLAAGVGQGHIVQEGAGDGFPLQDRLQEAQTIFYHSFGMQAIYQFLDGSDLGVCPRAGYKQFRIYDIFYRSQVIPCNFCIRTERTW